MQSVPQTIFSLDRYWQIWLMTAKTALQEAFVNRWTNALFFTGKAIRLAMMVIFLFLIRSQVQQFAGYTTDQLVVFFLTYQLIDTISQVFFRGVYLFGNLVKNGEFDFYLSKPINPLFRALTGKPDINDALFLIPTLFVSGWILLQLNITVTPYSVLLYLAFLAIGLLLAAGLHIVVMSVGILTVEVDGIIWLYRDVMRLGQFPATVYMELVRFALFVIVPVGVMVTIPTQLLLNLEPSWPPLAVLGFAGFFFWLCLRLWAWSIQHYSSASS